MQGTAQRRIFSTAPSRSAPEPSPRPNPQGGRAVGPRQGRDDPQSGRAVGPRQGSHRSPSVPQIHVNPNANIPQRRARRNTAANISLNSPLLLPTRAISRTMEQPVRAASPPRTMAAPPASLAALRREFRAQSPVFPPGGASPRPAFSAPPDAPRPVPTAAAAPPPAASGVPLWLSGSEEDESPGSPLSDTLLSSSWGSSGVRPCDIRDRRQWEKLRKQDEEVIAQSLEISLRLRDTAGAALNKAATWRKKAERRGLVAEKLSASRPHTSSPSDEDSQEPSPHHFKNMEALGSDAEGLHARSLRIEQTKQRQMELLEELAQAPSARIRGLQRSICPLQVDTDEQGSRGSRRGSRRASHGWPVAPAIPVAA
eukprot:Hpha_TRINITY_DN15151_c0_g1::TRINITY_DN15151_c0_g1_i1::g.127322::m.127322